MSTETPAPTAPVGPAVSVTLPRRLLAGARLLAPWILAAIAAYALLNSSVLVPRVSRLWQMSHPLLPLYLLLYAATGVSLAALLMSLHRYLLPFACLLLVVIVTTNAVARDVLDLKAVNEQTAEWLFWEIGEASNAASAFRGTITRHLALAVALLIPMVWVARAARRRLPAFVKSLPFMFGAAFAYAGSGLAIHHYFNPYIPVESNLLVFGAKLLLQSSPDVPPANVAPVRDPPVERIVLVIDESVTYDAYVTHLKEQYARWNPVDYGEAASLSNCSAAANSMLRWGFNAKSLLSGEDPRLAPPIWAYARAAGFETWLIDGQRNGAYQNFMRAKEAQLIDHHTGVDEGVYTDAAIARKLSALLRQPGRRIVYVNKKGSHFPYPERYPQEKYPGAQTTEEHYAKSVQHTSQRFLDVALAGVPLRGTLIIYTSDHGETFGEGSPHCNRNPLWQEASVPLVLLAGDAALADQARNAALVLHNRAGHEQIFATLLYAMGYDLQYAEARYGTSLLTPRAPTYYYFVEANPLPSKERPVTVTRFPHFPHRPDQQVSATGAAYSAP